MADHLYYTGSGVEAKNAIELLLLTPTNLNIHKATEPAQV